MSSDAVVQTHIDSAIKEEAAAVLATMGLTVSDAVRLLLTRVAQDHVLPFDVFIPNEETVAAMRDAREGRNMETSSLEQIQHEMRIQ